MPAIGQRIKKGVYQCFFCTVDFKTKKELQEHYEKEHKGLKVTFP